MEQGRFNRTDFIDIHPCYQLDAGHILTKTQSMFCILFHIFLGSLSLVTVLGNLLVIISIIYFKQLHTPTNSLILSLAVADLLVGVLVFPLTMEFSITSCMFYRNLLCKVRGMFDISLCTCSILNLCCISVDRYYAVCQPLAYRVKITDRIVLLMILVTWGVSAIIGISFITAGLNPKKCSTCLNEVILANVMGLLFSFYLPVVVMLCIYLKILTVALSQARSIHNTTCQSTKSGATVSKMERKATKTLATVMGVFLMCWLPFFLCTTIRSFTNVSVPLALLELLNWLALSNSTLNPLIYAFFYSWFRAAFRFIISGKIIQGDFTHLKLL